jgi:hypothetical protein
MTGRGVSCATIEAALGMGRGGSTVRRSIRGKVIVGTEVKFVRVGG